MCLGGAGDGQTGPGPSHRTDDGASTIVAVEATRSGRRGGHHGRSSKPQDGGKAGNGHGHGAPPRHGMKGSASTRRSECVTTVRCASGPVRRVRRRRAPTEVRTSALTTASEQEPARPSRWSPYSVSTWSWCCRTHSATGPKVDAADRRRDHHAQDMGPLARAISGLSAKPFHHSTTSCSPWHRRADRPLDRYCRSSRSRGITRLAFRLAAPWRSAGEATAVRHAVVA